MTLLEPRPNSPAALGYRWPAEWEPHVATWLAWPHNQHTWPDAFEPVPAAFAEFVRTLARFEPVHLCAGGELVLAQARSLIGAVPNVALHNFLTNDVWCRDHGPTFLQAPPHQPPALVHWRYNAWGGKYPFELDERIPRQIAEFRKVRRFEAGLVMEGGSIEGNGAGTVLTTTQCLLNPNRNPALSRHQIEQSLADFVGAKKVLWLSGGDLAGDDTDGHVDQLARFVGANIVLCAVENDPDDVNYAPLQTNFRELQSMTTATGERLEVIPLPLPGPKYHDAHDPSTRMPASYCNFVLANGAVIVPTFDDPQDAAALATLAALFPDRQVIGLSAVALIWGLGAFHCMSQQEPAPSFE